MSENGTKFNGWLKYFIAAVILAGGSFGVALIHPTDNSRHVDKGEWENRLDPIKDRVRQLERDGAVREQKLNYIIQQNEEILREIRKR